MGVVRPRKKYDRIPYETRVKIRRFCIKGLQKDAAVKFNVSKAVVCRTINEPLIKPVDKKPEVMICKRFGCGRPLSISEKLFGDLCLFHQK